jgi:hypothetical protein
LSTPIFNSSVFKQYFEPTDASAMAWATNVVQKLQDQGIVPKYISRTGVDAEDADYLAFWTPIALFWAYLVELARVFETLDDNDGLLREHLMERGYYSSNLEHNHELQFILRNTLRIRRERGTKEMYRPALVDYDSDSNSGEHSDSASGDYILRYYVDGELLRLIAWGFNDFFQLGLPQTKYVGWNVNNCSPLYTGLFGRYDLNIAYEFTKNFNSLAAYPLINTTYCSLFVDNSPDESDSQSGSDSLYHKNTDTPRTVLKITGTPIGAVAGIGNIDVSKMITIDPQLNYEITFEARQPILTNNLTFGCLVFDGVKHSTSLRSMVTGLAEQNFIYRMKLNRQDRFYFVRGIIYNKDEPLRATDPNTVILNIGQGSQLKFPANAVKIIPYIVCDGRKNDYNSDLVGGYNINDVVYVSATGLYYRSLHGANFDSYPPDSPADWVVTSAPTSTNTLEVWNVKINVVSLEYSNALLNTSKHVDMFVKNNNAIYSRDQLYSIIRKYFMPYNTGFSITHLGL